MPRPLWNEICEAFGEAVEREGDQRARFLAGLPAPVRAEVESLLGAHLRAGRFIEPEDDETIPPGERFGPYRITGRVAQGGMGIVYRARRDDGEFDQEVALKVISGALASRDAERMFLRERQILAGLSHPHIVKLLDGGVSDGRRYFVMEWLDGQPLLDACRALDPTARLHLFRQICSAIH
ncbi:MAG: protein kinase, partial [Bryobacteraceae bacterium]|nr:protein kinase [Bryobacteraceae bacterium]